MLKRIDMLDWKCMECGNRKTLSDRIVPGKCECGGWYKENKNEDTNEKVYHDGVIAGYARACKDFIRVKDNIEEYYNDVEGTLIMAREQLEARYLEMKEN